MQLVPYAYLLFFVIILWLLIKKFSKSTMLAHVDYYYSLSLLFVFSLALNVALITRLCVNKIIMLLNISITCLMQFVLKF